MNYCHTQILQLNSNGQNQRETNQSSTIEEEEEKDDNKEAVAAEQNCKLGDLLQQNMNNETEGYGYLEGDPDEQEEI